MWEPFGRAPENDTAYWKEGPNGRGTFSILSTCLITLSLCVYTSLHLNIPEHGKTYWRRQFWNRAWWVLLGVATPECIAYIAIRDWLWARNLDVDMVKALQPLTPAPTAQIDHNDPEQGNTFSTTENEDAESTNSRPRTASSSAQTLSETGNPNPDPARYFSTQTDGLPRSTAQRKYKWSRSHSYFALMGGFAVDTSDLSVNVLDNGKTRGTLTPAALRTISIHDPRVLPDISKEEIEDKSKANGLAKLLVCLQAAWFCAQMLGRLATAENPISLLELNTFLHAICCLATYLAWFRKPLNISEPELIDTSKEENLSYYARICVEKKLHCTIYGSGKEATKDYSGTLVPEKLPSGPRNIVPCSANNFYTFASRDVTAELEAVIDRLGQERDQLELGLYHQQTCLGYSLTITPDPGPSEVYARLKWSDIHCLMLVRDWTTKAQPMDPTKPETKWLSAESLDTFVDHAPMVGVSDKTLKRLKRSHSSLRGMFSTTDDGEVFDMVFWLGLMVACLVYGGVHLLAWDGPFHTTKERLMWRIACIIVASPLLVLPLYSLFAWILLAGKEKKTAADTHADGIAQATFDVPTLMYMLLYGAARVYLVVECFINLSHLPLEVYKEPAWSRYIPHFSAG